MNETNALLHSLTIVVLILGTAIGLLLVFILSTLESIKETKTRRATSERATQAKKEGDANG